MKIAGIQIAAGPDLERNLQCAASPSLPYPSKLYVETTTECNLACPMCVKQTWGRDETDGFLTPGVFGQILPALPRLDVLILNGIGEPLLHPHLETFVRTAKKHMPTASWVGFQSNGLLIDDARARSLVASGLDKICISMDAVDPSVYGSLRGGGAFRRVEHAFSALQSAKKNVPHAPLQIGIEFVAMKENLHELPRVLRWAAGHGATFAIVTHLLPYHKSMVSHTLFNINTDKAVALFRGWKEKARAEGIDICRYPDVYLKYGKAPDELKVIETVEAMKAEAFSKGVFLHVDNLLRRGDVRAREVAEVFDEASAVAAETGMDIRLPEVVPRSERTCEFVEEGGAFVSWNGNVHPCYFLWHRYRCFIGGYEKFVKPRVFGNLEGQGILEIWNSPTYREFRDNVLGYDYPFCFNCGFALCDYVQEEDFQQDCYVNAEPCGACLWCQGVFHCLR